MLKKIKLKNFMSHKSSEFELAKGVNVITGPNNSGKSAVISALQLLADLPVKEGDYMVRHGTTESAVTVETDEGDELTWQRKGSTMSLIINEDRDIRLQNNRDHYLEKLHKYLKLPKVSGNETKQDFDIHFATQKNPIFLINEPPSRAALFFASSSDAGRLFEVRDRYKELVKAKRREQQTTKAALEEQIQILDRLNPLDEVEELFKFVQETYKQFPNQQESLRLGTILLLELRTLTKKFNSFSSTCQLLRILNQPPQLEDAHKLDLHHKALTAGLNCFAALSDKHKVLSRLAEPPELLNTADITKSLHDLRQTERNKQRFEQSRTLLDTLKVRPEIEDTESLASLLKDMHEHTLTIKKLKSQRILFGAVNMPPVLEPESKFSTFLSHFHQITLRASILRERVQNLTRLSKIPEIDNLPHIERDYRILKDLTSKQSLARRIHCALSGLVSPPPIGDISKLEEYLVKLKDISNRHAIYSQRYKIGNLSKPLPEFEDIMPLEKHLTNYYLQAESVQQLTKQLYKAECALREWVEAHPTCPTCGGNLNIEKLQASICNG